MTLVWVNAYIISVEFYIHIHVLYRYEFCIDYLVVVSRHCYLYTLYIYLYIDFCPRQAM